MILFSLHSHISTIQNYRSLIAACEDMSNCCLNYFRILFHHWSQLSGLISKRPKWISVNSNIGCNRTGASECQEDKETDVFERLRKRSYTEAWWVSQTHVLLLKLCLFVRNCEIHKHSTMSADVRCFKGRKEKWKTAKQSLFFTIGESCSSKYKRVLFLHYITLHCEFSTWPK